MFFARFLVLPTYKHFARNITAVLVSNVPRLVRMTEHFTDTQILYMFILCVLIQFIWSISDNLLLLHSVFNIISANIVLHIVTAANRTI